MKQNLHLMATLWPLLRLQAFFNRRLDPTKMQSLSGAGTPKVEAHMEVLWQTRVGCENSQPTPRPSPPSLTLPSGPIPMCPAYTSVKNPKSGTLANSKRLHSGRKAYREGHGVGWNGCPSTIRDWLKYGRAIVLPLFGCASAFSRNVVEGFSKPTRTIVEALSKDCRTSLEQQSNTCRRNFEESCVWTHAMVPARYGLGLALGLMVTLFLTIMCLETRAQAPDVFSGPAVTALNQTLIEGTVRSGSTNMPIEGAKIRLSQSDTIVFTDADGTFSIATARKEGEVEVSFAGYMPIRKPFDETGIGASASTFRLPTDVTTIDKLLLGDTIPVNLWDLPLTVVNHPKGRHTVTLREYQDKKLIVLDFWARWCSPCVKSVDHWGQAQTEFPDELAVITVHVDFPDRALPFMQNRGWQVPAVIGVPGDYLNAYFHRARQVGSVIWIYQGRFYAAPKDKKYPIAELKKLLDGDPMGDIPSTMTYLHKTK